LAADSNIAQGLLTGCEQHHRALEPLLAHITMRRDTQRCPEHPGKVERTEASDTRKPCNRDALVQVLRNVIQDATQPHFVKPV
jgi:hypothetical protein